jgi:hypothetical protein
MAPVTSQDYYLVKVKCTDLTSTTSPEGQWTGSEQGGIGGDPVPSNVTADMDLAIDSRYRGGHPVQHCPGGSSSDLGTPRQWSDDFKTSFDTAATNELNAINGISDFGGGTLSWVVLRGYRPGAMTSDVEAYPVQSVELRTYVGTMRRRARSLR